MVIGLDLTRNHVSAVLVDLSGQVVRYQRKSKSFSLDDVYLRELGKLAETIMDGACTSEKIPGVGISLPGIMDRSKRISTAHCDLAPAVQEFCCIRNS